MGSSPKAGKAVRQEGRGGQEATSSPRADKAERAAVGAAKARSKGVDSGQGAAGGAASTCSVPPEPAHPQLFYFVERFQPLVLNADPLPSPKSNRATLLAYLDKYLEEKGAPRPEEGERWEESMARFISYFSGEEFTGGDAQACFSKPGEGKAKMNEDELHSRDIYPEAWAAPFEQATVRKAQKGTKEGRGRISQAGEKVQQRVERAVGSPRTAKSPRTAAVQGAACSPRMATSPRAMPSSPSKAGTVSQQQAQEEGAAAPFATGEARHAGKQAPQRAGQEGTQLQASGHLTDAQVLQYRLLMHLATSNQAVDAEELEEREIAAGPAEHQASAVERALQELLDAGQVKRLGSSKSTKYVAMPAGNAVLPSYRAALLEHAKGERYKGSELVEEGNKLVGLKGKQRFADDKWYEGTIADFDGWHHLVNYDDGDQDWQDLEVDFKDGDFRLLDRPGSGGQSSKSGSEGRGGAATQAGAKRRRADGDRSTAAADGIEGAAGPAGGGGPCSGDFELHAAVPTEGRGWPKRRKPSGPPTTKPSATAKRGADEGAEAEAVAQAALPKVRTKRSGQPRTVRQQAKASGLQLWVSRAVKPEGIQQPAAMQQQEQHDTQQAAGGVEGERLRWAARAGHAGLPSGQQQVVALPRVRVSLRRQSPQHEQQQVERAVEVAAAEPADQLASSLLEAVGGKKRKQALGKAGTRAAQEHQAPIAPGDEAAGAGVAAAAGEAGISQEEPVPPTKAAVQKQGRGPRQRQDRARDSVPAKQLADSSKPSADWQRQGHELSTALPTGAVAGDGDGAIEGQHPARRAMQPRKAAAAAMQRMADAQSESSSGAWEQPAGGQAAAAAGKPAQQPRSRAPRPQSLGGVLVARPSSTVVAEPPAEQLRPDAQATAPTLTKEDCYWWRRKGVEADRITERRVLKAGYKSCHDCQSQHYIWECKSGKPCTNTICVSCTRKYDYLFEPGHDADLRKFCKGWCPDCIGICNRVMCLRKTLRSMGQEPPEVPASQDQKLVQALHMAFQLIEPARQMYAENEAQALRQGMRLEDVPRLKVDSGERVLCNLCATTIENAHYHCACDADLCLKCAAEFQPGPGPVSCLSCHTPTKLQQIFDRAKVLLLAGAEKRLQQVYEHGPLSRWLQELYTPSSRSWMLDGQPITELCVAANEEEGEEHSGRQAAPSKRGKKRKEASEGAGAAAAQHGEPSVTAAVKLSNGIPEAPTAHAGLAGAHAEQGSSPQAHGHMNGTGTCGESGGGSWGGGGCGGGGGSGSGKRQRKPTERAVASAQQEAAMHHCGIGGLLVEQAAQHRQANGALPGRVAAPLPQVPPSEFLARTAFRRPDDSSIQMRCWWQRYASLVRPEDLRLAAQRAGGIQNLIWTPHVSVFARDNPLRAEATRLFIERWQLGEPVVVRGFMGRLDWGPDTMERVTRKMSKNLDQKSLHLSVLDCSNFAPATISCHDFFNLYKRCHGAEVDERGRPLTMYKLKDWPIDASFVEKMARHNDDFLEMLNSCMPAYMHPIDRDTGVLNLANHLPSYVRKPDLGPKGYIAYGREKEHTGEGDSVTKLHEDLSEAINIMCHTELPPGMAAPKPRHGKDQMWDPVHYGYAGAVWDVFRGRDRDQLKKFLLACVRGQHPELPPFEHQGRELEESDVYHPIHAQCFMLTAAHRKVLADKYGVHPWHFEQYCWEGVCVPGGTPHQVRNLRSSIKVALDFVTPESLAECVRLKAEFRELVLKEVQQRRMEQDPANYYYADRLQVRNMVAEGLAWALHTLEENEQRVQ